MKNKIKYLIMRLKYELKYIFEKTYKTKVVIILLELFRLIYNNLLSDLT